MNALAKMNSTIDRQTIGEQLVDGGLLLLRPSSTIVGVEAVMTICVVADIIMNVPAASSLLLLWLLLRNRFCHHDNRRDSARNRQLENRPRAGGHDPIIH